MTLSMSQQCDPDNWDIPGLVIRNWKRSDISDLEVCWAAKVKSPREFITDVLAHRFPNCPAKVLYAALERASDRGLIEFGVSLRSGWLTAKGVELIRANLTAGLA